MPAGRSLSEIHRLLAPVRTRQRWRSALRAGALGLLAGSLAAAGLGTVRLMSAPLPEAWILALPVVGSLGGFALGLGRRRSWKEAAAAVDAHYRLKDRLATALAFAELPQRGPLHDLQIADAAAHLDAIDLRPVVPLRMPRSCPYAALAGAVAVVLLLIPSPARPRSAGPVLPMPEVVAEGRQLEATLIHEFQELSRQNPEENVDELVQELRRLVGEMKAPRVDQREALARLSEMQAAIASVLDDYNLEAVDAVLQALGQALESVEAMQGVSGSLARGDYRRAAEELDSLDPADIRREQSRAAAGKLKRLAKDLGTSVEAGVGESISQWQEALESPEASRSEKIKTAAGQLARHCRSQAARKSIERQLRRQLADLDESKQRCAQRPNASQDSRQGWGRGTAGDPFGDHRTSIASQHRREELVGARGEGPAEREVTQAMAQREWSGRSYREAYPEYEKMAEAVLQSEPLPLGYRQTIRRYFELIRPQNRETLKASHANE
jgi:hypothetical protein